MNALFRSCIFVFAALSASGICWCFGAFGLKAAESEPQQNGVGPGETRQAAISLTNLVFHGLFLGMPVEVLPKVVQSNFVGWNLIHNNGDSRDFLLECPKLIGADGIRICFDDSGKLFVLFFTPKAAENVSGFGAGLTPQQFVDKFMKVYAVPKMTQTVTQAESGYGPYWDYTTKDKILIRITGSKSFAITQK